MKTFIKYAILILLVIFTIGFMTNASHYYLHLLIKKSSFIGFGIGLISSIFICILLKRHLWYFMTFRHELTHNLFSVFCLQKPGGFHINSDGTGSYNFYGKRLVIVSLSPYFFPTVTFTFLILQLLFGTTPPFYNILLGLALGFDLVSQVSDYGFYQSDWQNHGVLFSLLFSILGLICCVISVVLIIFFGYHTLWYSYSHVWHDLVKLSTCI